MHIYCIEYILEVYTPEYATDLCDTYCKAYRKYIDQEDLFCVDICKRIVEIYPPDNGPIIDLDNVGLFLEIFWYIVTKSSGTYSGNY